MQIKEKRRSEKEVCSRDERRTSKKKKGKIFLDFSSAMTLPFTIHYLILSFESKKNLVIIILENKKKNMKNI